MLVKNGICFNCCNSAEYSSKNCPEKVVCSVCAGDSHPSALHIDYSRPQGGEKRENTEIKKTVNNNCAQICGVDPGGGHVPRQIWSRYPQEELCNYVRTYALIDDQSKCSLAKSELFDLLGIKTETKNFKLETCSGVKKNMTSRVAKNLLVTSVDDSTTHQLPPVIECDAVPDNRNEIATPDIVNQFSHLKTLLVTTQN